ncbi:MAG TPA: FAD/NAD(P)-binding oxidoreductase [Candidatus Limnocylindria bacterium]|nr:FAD/NAD(P)-binding oxidoreductase [Candidatus Limnocylindria bacterium]
MAPGKTTLVLGGGVGGLTAAHTLRDLVGPEHRVVLVERRPDHLFAPSLLWLMVGDRRRGQLTRDLAGMLRPGIELVQAEVTALDPERRIVRAGDRELPYDALVVALGAELAPDTMPGYAEAAHNFFDLDGAARLDEALRAFAGGKVVVAVSALPYKCPAAPYEAALLIEAALRRRGVRDRSEVAIFTPEPQPMPVAGPVLGGAVSQLLAERRIVLNTGRTLAAIDPVGKALVFTDGAREPFDLLAAVPPHRAPEPVRRSALANESGWIPVDARTLRTRFPDVYAIGDGATITLANGKPLPKAGVFAHAQALSVAHEIAASFAERPRRAFDGKGYCWVELGDGRAAFAEGDFYATPSPEIRLRAPNALWHVGKVLFERSWMGRGVGRLVATTALRAGARIVGIKASL